MKRWSSLSGVLLQMECYQTWSVVLMCVLLEYLYCQQICEQLMTRCLAPDCRMGGVGCDNMTVIVVCLLQGGDYDELCARCGRHSTTGNSSKSLAANTSNNKFNRTIETSEEDGDEWYDCCEDEPPESCSGHEGMETINTTTQETVKVTQESDTTGTADQTALRNDEVTYKDTGTTQCHNDDYNGVHDDDVARSTSSSSLADKLSCISTTV